MATALALLSTDECDTCVLCTSKHNRIRPSFCLCKHCSIPLCLDCMKEHHDEVLQNVAQISHQYNELQELIQTKQKLIVDESVKSIEDVNQYFDIYINELRETQQNIIADIQTAKQDAQNYVLQIGSNLQTLSIDIRALAKESIVQTTKMNILSTELKKIELQVNTYQVTRTENLIKTKPEFSFKFKSSSAPVDASQSSTIKAIRVSMVKSKELPSTVSSSNTLKQHAVQHNLVSQPKKVTFDIRDADCWISDDDDNTLGFGGIPTSYTIDRMASDGENILYTSYYDNEEPDLLAYCLVNDISNSVDRYRDWKQSRIVDMIWWDNIEKFVCATELAIYTVDYADGRFKIVCVIRGSWSHNRLAANTNNIFLHYITNSDKINQLDIYTSNFQVVRVFDLSAARYLPVSASFCVTDQCLASICTRQQNNRQVFQVNMFDLNMNELKCIHLGICNGSIEIRSDGKELFFISTGRQKLHIVSLSGIKNTVNLKNDGDCIAVLDNRRIAVSKQRKGMEIITY